MRRFLLVALLSALAGAAHAQSWLDQPGVVGSTTVELGNARVRLPPGEWRQVAETSFTYKGEQIPIIERVFIQSEGQRVVALAYTRSLKG